MEVQQEDKSAAAAASTAASKPSVLMRWLTTLTMIGCFLGLGAGMLCQATSASRGVVRLIGFPGVLWVRALKCMVVPMIFTSMICSVASASDGSSAVMAKTAIQFYTSTTVVAAFEGIVFFNIFSAAFQPLSPANDAILLANSSSAAATMNANSNASAVIMPDSAAAAERLTDHNTNTALDTVLEFGQDLVPENLVALFLNSQLLGLITFAIFLGGTLHASPKGKIVVDLAQALFETFVAMIKKVILLTPLGVCSLVAGSIASAKDVGVVFTSLSALLAVVFLAQAVHAIGFYSLVYLAVLRRNPFKYFSGLPRVWATAFGTSSSAATLSTTTDACLALGVSKEAAQFCLPIGATINMDGSALERPIIVLWIAYVASVPVSIGGQLIVAVTSVLLSVGASPIPSAGVSTLIVMVEQAGIPLTPEVMLATSICLAVEWLLDRVRTTVNVTGDAVGVAIVDGIVQRRRQQRLLSCHSGAGAGAGGGGDGGDGSGGGGGGGSGSEGGGSGAGVVVLVGVAGGNGGSSALLRGGGTSSCASAMGGPASMLARRPIGDSTLSISSPSPTSAAEGGFEFVSSASLDGSEPQVV